MNISTQQVRTLLQKFPSILNENSVIEIKPGCDKFDGYNSYLYKVTINNQQTSSTNKTDTISNKDKHELILKCAPEDEHYRQLMTVDILYKNEIYVYDQIFPEFYKLQDELKLDVLPALPKYITSVSSPYKEVLILEDVRQFGYEMRNKKLFLDEEHLGFALREFAKLHAFSFALKHKNPEVYQRAVEDLRKIHGKRHCNVRDEFHSWYQSPLNQLIDMFHYEEDVQILKKIQNIKDNLEEYMEEIYEYRGNYGVVSHMDCWTNNMLFKYKVTKLESICFLDFQYAYFVSPIVDFVYVFYSTGKPDQYPKYSLYKTMYYETLGQTLKSLKLDVNQVYPKEVFEEELILYGKYGFLRGILGVPMSMRDEKDIVDVKDVVDQGLEGCNAFGIEKWSPECVDWMKKLALHCIENKFI